MRSVFDCATSPMACCKHHRVNALATIPTFPNRAIIRRARIIAVITTLHPLQHIAGCVIQPEWVRLEAANCSRTVSRILRTTVEAVAAPDFEIITPTVGSAVTRRCSVFPFGFTEQAIDFPSFRSKPLAVRIRVIPAYVHDRGRDRIATKAPGASSPSPSPSRRWCTPIAKSRTY